MSDRPRSPCPTTDGWGAVQVPDLAFWRQEALLVPSRFRRLYLGIELCALYLGLPLLLYTQRHALDGWVMPILMGLAAGCTLLLWYDGSFNRKQLWNREAFRVHVRRTLCWFVPGALLVETADGVVRVSAGDCEHLRPVDAS